MVMAPPASVVSVVDFGPAQTAHVVVFAVAVAVVTLFTTVRLFVASVVVHRVLLEDWICVISWAFLMAYAASIFMATAYGEGVNVELLPAENVTQYGKWIYIASVLFIPSAFFTKVTLLLLMHRVLAVSAYPMVERLIWALILLMALYYTPVEMMRIIVCKPIQALWDPSVVPKSSCLDYGSLLIAGAALSIPVDVAIFAIPFALTLRLQNMSRATKLRVISLFSTGGVALVFTIFRLVFVVRYPYSSNPTRDMMAIDIADLMEIGLGITCACLPAANMLARRVSGSRRRASQNVPRTGLLSRRRNMRTALARYMAPSSTTLQGSLRTSHRKSSVSGGQGRPRPPAGTALGAGEGDASSGPVHEVERRDLGEPPGRGLDCVA